MIKLIISTAVISLLALSGEPKVFICNSENAVAYHRTKDCRGIKQCKKKIQEVTQEEAKKKGLKLCGWED